MKDLMEMFVAAGCEQVRSYINSGNVIFSATAGVVAKLTAVIPAAVGKKFGFSPPVQMRSAQELAAVVAANPWLKLGMDEDALHVLFLADKPSPAAVAKLDPERSAPDRFLVIGQEIYLCLPGGIRDTKLTNAYFDSKLATVSTGRNFRTVRKLLELMQV